MEQILKSAIFAGSVTGTEEGLSGGSIVLRIVSISVILIFIFLIAVAVLIITRPDLFRKKTEEEELGTELIYDADISPRTGDTKSFLPYRKIGDYSIDLGGHDYRAILEVSSINYHLMSGTEQEMVNASFRRFLDSLDFPVEIYIQTREFDHQRVVEDLEERSAEAIKRYPRLREYFSQYIYEMGGITERFANSKVKKKYMIIPFDSSDLLDVSELTEAETEAFALENLISRCNICASGLGSIGLDVTLLGRTEITEVLYSYYHRDYFRIAEDIADGSLTSLVINGPGHRSDDRYILDSILSGAQNSIRTRLVNADTTDEELAFYRYIVNELERYKQDDLPRNIALLMRDSYEEAEANGYEDDYYGYARHHPEARFWEAEERTPESGKVTVPDDIKKQMETGRHRDEGRTLGGRIREEMCYGEFDPDDKGGAH